MTTKRQKAAVRFCEETLHVSFEGDINDRKQVSNFLDMYLEDAKFLLAEAQESYGCNFDW